MSTTSRKRAFSGISSVEKAIDKLSKISSENKVTDNEFDYFGKSFRKYMEANSKILEEKISIGDF